MVTLAGTMRKDFALFAWDSHQPAWPATEGLPLGLRTNGIDAASMDRGDFTENLPTDFLSRTFAGWTYSLFFHDYYNRVWIIPSTVDFGPVTAETTANVFLWNAFLHSVDLTAVGAGSDPSVTLTGLTVPTTYKSLAGAYFGVKTGVDGPANIDTAFTFTFGTFDEAVLPVLGTRARLWPWPPNWESGFEVNYELRTEIITSDSGEEQRSAIRQSPRKTFRFTSHVHQNEFRAFARQMNAWHDLTTAVPEFSKFFRSAAAIPDGTDSVLVESVPDWAVAGTLVALIYEGKRILRTIDSVAGLTIAFTSAVAGDFPVDLKIYKAVTGRLESNISASQYTNRLATVACVFNADPGVEVYPSAGPFSATHNGRELLLKRPNWGDRLAPSFTSYLKTVDYGVGRADYFSPIPYNDRFHKANYIGRDIAEGEEMERFYRRCLGQLHEFYMPTFTEDIVLKETLNMGATSMRIEGADFARDMQGDTIYKDLIVYTDDGNHYARHILSIYEVNDTFGNDTIIQIDEAFPLALSVYTVRQICWLPLWRLASDSMTFQYVTDEVTQFSMTMKTLEYRDAE